MDHNGSKKKSKSIKHYGHHRLGFWLSVVTAVLVVLGMIILTLLPYAMEWGAERMLLRFGAKTATIADIDFNPMTGHLTVFDLQVEGPNADRADMERLIVKIDLFPIIKKRIRFRQISLTGFSMDVRQLEDGKMTFGGLSIPESPETRQPEPGVENDPNQWGLGLRNLDIKEVTVRLITPDLDETVVLNHLILTNFETWTPEKSGDYVLRADLLGGAVEVEGVVQAFTQPITVSARIGLRELSMERFTPYIRDTPVGSLSGSLSGRGQVNATLNLESTLAVASTVRFDIYSRDMSVQAASEGLELELQPGALNIGISLDTSIDIGDSSSRQADFAVTARLEGTASRAVFNGTTFEVLQDALSLAVKGSYSDTGSVDPSQLLANGGLSLKGLVLKDSNRAAELVRLGSFDIEGIEIKGPDDIRTSLTRAGDIVLFSRLPESIRKGEPEQALAMKNLEVTGISLSDRSHFAVEAVQMDSINAWVLREKEGDLEVIRIMQGIMDKGSVDASDVSEETQIGDSHSESSVLTNVGGFSLTGENRLAFMDLNVEPPFNYIVDSLSFQILNLDTGELDTSTSVTLNAGMGKYSEVSVTGTVQPPWDTPGVDMHVRLKAIDLPPLTPYTTKYLGYILRSGHLDTKMDILMEKGILDSQAEILVNRIVMDAVKEEDEQRAEERLGIPVKTALSLLTDKNDDISLTLPVEGNIRDPEFDVSSVVVTATGLALQKGVTAYYKGLGATLLTGGLIPPGTFSVLGKLFSGVTTMTFEPVVFGPLDPELNEPAIAYLDLMAEKLESKPKVRLVLCGKVTTKDIIALRQADFEAALAATVDQAPGGTAGSLAGVDLSESATRTIVTGETTEFSTKDSTKDSQDIVEEIAPAGPPSIDEVPLSDDEKERLIDLAKQRAFSVKDHLTEVGGLDPERLFVCYSEVDTEEPKLPPRVDLSI
jgi:hypothetical protein